MSWADLPPGERDVVRHNWAESLAMRFHAISASAYASEIIGWLVDNGWTPPPETVTPEPDRYEGSVSERLIRIDSDVLSLHARASMHEPNVARLCDLVSQAIGALHQSDQTIRRDVNTVAGVLRALLADTIDVGMARAELDALLDDPECCPAGCGCRYANDADESDCACHGPCTEDEWTTIDGIADDRRSRPEHSSMAVRAELDQHREALLTLLQQVRSSVMSVTAARARAEVLNQLESTLTEIPGGD